MRCPRCSSSELTIIKGKPPHFAQEVCVSCGRWLRRLPQIEALAPRFCCRAGCGELALTEWVVDVVPARKAGIPNGS